jgi:ATP-dependent Clp protease adaptor protein ClpS
MAITLGSTLSVGDLLAGLAGMGTLIDETLRRRALDPTRFDAEPPLPAVGHHSEAAMDAPVDVIVVNDDETRMDFVVDALQRHFGIAATRASYLMQRVHHCGRARICTRPRAEAERAIDATHEEARAKGFPLAFVYGPRR